MNFYIAKIVFQIKHLQNQTQFDEQIRLIEADDAAEAFAKATLIGFEEEQQLTTANGKQLHWKFVNIADLQPLDNLQHGSQLYSFTSTQEEPNNYIRFVKNRAQQLSQQATIFA